MAFIFETKFPQKVHLHVSSEAVPAEHVLDVEHIVDVLKRSIELPENGRLQHLTTIDNLQDLVWNFSSFTKCSDASVHHFCYVRDADRTFEFKNPCPKRKYQLALFCS